MITERPDFFQEEALKESEKAAEPAALMRRGIGWKGCVLTGLTDAAARASQSRTPECSFFASSSNNCLGILLFLASNLFSPLVVTQAPHLLKV